MKIPFMSEASAVPLAAPNLSSDHLAGMRTLMGADRTLMAWTRTSLSLLSFGFTIYKVLEGFQETSGGQLASGQTPRNAGLVLTGLGTLSMLMGTIEYWQTRKQLSQFELKHTIRYPMIMATIMTIAGLFLFFSIALKAF